MREIGDKLRAAREAKGLSIQDLYEKTRIRAKLIQALEDGDFSQVPGGMVYTKGFLRALCEELDLNYADISAMLGEKAPASTQVVRKVSSAKRRRRRSLTWLVLLLIGLMAAGGLYVMWRDREPPVDPPIAEDPPVHIPDPEPEPPPVEEPEPQPEPEPLLTLISEAGERRVFLVQPWPAELTVQVDRESCWFRVTSGTEQLASTTLSAGRSATYTADGEITLRLGNPRVVTLTINGIRLEGLPDRVRDYVFLSVSP